MKSVALTGTIEELYRNSPYLIPYGLKNTLGQFNVLDIAEQATPKHNHTDYRRKDFYKIKMLSGHFLFHYTDKSIEINGTALIFVHPYIHYKFEFIKEEISGYLCIFKEDFFEHFSPAKALLKYTSWNISDIGYSLGFDGSAYFIRSFKSHAGLTPKAFREAGH